MNDFHITEDQRRILESNERLVLTPSRYQGKMQEMWEQLPIELAAYPRASRWIILPDRKAAKQILDRVIEIATPLGFTVKLTEKHIEIVPLE
jgi:hypothetical protein